MEDGKRKKLEQMVVDILNMPSSGRASVSDLSGTIVDAFIAEVSDVEAFINPVMDLIEHRLAIIWSRPGSREFFADELRHVLSQATVS